jgi:lantibiotic modifying enzyme
MDGWRPILEGEFATKAKARIAQILASLDFPEHGEVPRDTDPTLAEGHAGIALFIANAEREKSVPNIARGQDVAVSVLTRALQDIDDRWRTPYLYSGILGPAWALSYMFNQFGSALELSLQELEDQLIELCAASDSALEPDLIYGFNGIGVYAFERWPSKFTSDCIPLLIERLADAHWSDLGLAHGAAGVIAFLSAAARLDAGWRARIRPIVERHIDRLLRQRLPADETTCCFPSEIGGGPTRLAWCLGDTSIAVALLAAGSAFEREDWCSAARELAVAAAKRPLGFSGVVDAGLCHGAAGLGHVFNRLFQATGEQRLAVAAREWFSLALDMPARSAAPISPDPNCSARRCRCQRKASRDFLPGPTAKAWAGTGSPIAAFSLAPRELGSR